MTCRGRAALVAVAVVLGSAACGSDGQVTVSPSTSEAPVGVPRVTAVAVTPDGDGTFRFDVTVSSPYDSPVQYADAWRVTATDGRVLGVRELAHDHAGEQPFTRSLAAVAVPAGVEVVLVEARDLIEGWSGEVLEVDVAVSG